MKRREPPQFATWMLKHLTAGDRDEALEGDLLEEFHAGRSKIWFWRQVIVAVLLRSMLGVFHRRIVLIFAIAWSLLSPAWQVIFIQFDHESDFAGFIWRMPWPWSTLCDFGWNALKDLTFVWIGAFLYIALLAMVRKGLHMRTLVPGIGLSVVAYCITLACWIWAITLLEPKPVAGAVDWHTLTVWNAIVKIGFGGIAPGLPSIVAMVCVLWGIEGRSARPLSLAQ